MDTHENKKGQFRLPLEGEVKVLQQEARMVLPGIQTLFGFQLIAVFNASFKEQLNITEQYLHLAALLLVAVSCALVIAPAAYHRQAEHHISEHFIKVGARFLSWALTPLAIGTSLDIYIVSKLITESVPLSIFFGFTVFVFYAGIWLIYPQMSGRRKQKKT